VNRYEKGAPASMDVAEKLEKLLHTKLIQGINVFEFPAMEHRPLLEEKIPYHSPLEQLHELGLKLSVFEHAPLTAAGREQPLIISHAENDSILKRKAVLLSRTQSILRHPGMILTKNSKLTRVENIPVMEAEELSTFSNIEDMLNALKEKLHGKRSKTQHE
jgi:predicted transcriptional regulator